MTALPLPIGIALAVLVIVAAVCDLRRRRIPNWLTLPALGVGLVLSFLTGGPAGLGTAALGTALAFAVYFGLFALRAMGGGDVKLMAAVGALTGPSNWLFVFVFTAIIGGLLALALILARGGLQRALSNIAVILSEFAHFRAPYNTRSELDVSQPGAMRLPHGISIACGVLLYLLMSRGT